MSAGEAAMSYQGWPIEAEKVRYGSDVHNRVCEFLIEEADLLDRHDLHGWYDLLTEDIRYSAPLRVTKHRADPEGEIIRRNMHYYETLVSLKNRIRRLKDLNCAWAEDPPSRTRRFVTNIAVRATEAADEFFVTSYLMLARSRFENPDYQFITCERRDMLRLVDDRFRLARREIILDMSVLGTPNLAIFL